MASDTNTITISGNMTRDPEMRYTPSGVSKVTFGVAVNRSWRNQQTQEWDEQTSFFNVVCVAGAGRERRRVARQGSRVVVTGRLEQRSWETEQGEKRSIVEIVADDVSASLRFATAEVHRVERSGPSDGGAARRVRRPCRRRPVPQPAAATTSTAKSRSNRISVLTEFRRRTRDVDAATSARRRVRRRRTADRSRRRRRSSTRSRSSGSTTRTSTCCGGSCRSAPRSAPAG